MIESELKEEMESYSKEEIKQLLDTESSEYVELNKMVLSYIQKGNSKLVEDSFDHAKTRISSQDDVSSPFNFLKNPAAIAKYAKYISGFLMFLIQHIRMDPFVTDLLSILEFKTITEFMSKQCSLQYFLFTIVSQRYEIWQPKLSNNLIRYLAFSCMKIDHDHNKISFNKPDYITKRIDIFKYMIRLVVLTEIVEKQMNEILMAVFMVFVRDESNSYSFGMLSDLLTRVADIAKIELMLRPNINWIDTIEFSKFEIGGKQIEISHLTRCVLYCCDRASQKIRSICLGNIIKLPNHIVDLKDLSDPGYSFINEYIDSELIGSFAKQLMPRLRFTNGSINHLEIEKLLAQCEKVIEYLFVAIHISAGIPGRGTELPTIQIRNNELQNRGLYVSEGKIFIITRYANKCKKRLLARFLPTRVSMVLMMYLFVVRPLECWLLEFAARKDDMSSHSTYLFASFGSVWTPAIFSKVFTNIFICSTGISLEFSEYRHVAEALIRKKVDCKVLNMYTFSSQDVHSNHTAIKRYGICQVSLNEGHEEDIFKNQMTSRTWQALLHIASEDILSTKDETVIESLQTIEAQDNFEVKSLLHKLEDCERVDNRLIDLNDHPHLPRPPAESRKLVAALNLYLQSNEGQIIPFRSQGQYDAVDFAMRRCCDLCIVLPSGGGKSAIIGACCILEPEAVTVVVVPLVALFSDLCSQLTEIEIKSIVWTHPLIISNDVRCIFVSAEMAATSNFKTCLRLLESAKKLSRIVVDEAHLAITDSDYQNVYGELYHLRDMRTPLILLTATLPVTLQQALFKAFNVFPIVIREPIARKNIHLSVVCSDEYEQMMVKFIEQHLEQNHKIIVYCRNYIILDRVQGLLGGRGLIYHDKLEQGDKESIFRDFVSGKAMLIIATCGFALGVHIDNIDVVVHYKYRPHTLDYIQQIGRAGRNPETRAYAIVFVPSAFIDPYVESKTCRFELLYTQADPLHSGDCTRNGVLECCDVCESLTSFVIQLQTKLLPAAKLGNVSVTHRTKRRRKQDLKPIVEKQLKIVFNSAKKTNICILCNVYWHVMVEHANLNECPIGYGRCSRCLSPYHHVNDCSMKIWHNACSSCCMPIDFHPTDITEFGPNCNLAGRDFVLPLVFLAFRYKPNLFSKHLDFPSDETEFMIWLKQMHECNLTNCAVMCFHISCKMHHINSTKDEIIIKCSKIHPLGLLQKLNDDCNVILQKNQPEIISGWYTVDSGDDNCKRCAYPIQLHDSFGDLKQSECTNPAQSVVLATVVNALGSNINDNVINWLSKFDQFTGVNNWIKFFIVLCNESEQPSSNLSE